MWSFSFIFSLSSLSFSFLLLFYCFIVNCVNERKNWHFLTHLFICTCVICVYCAFCVILRSSVWDIMYDHFYFCVVYNYLYYLFVILFFAWCGLCYVYTHACVLSIAFYIMWSPSHVLCCYLCVVFINTEYLCVV